jgi:subtilisin-like proprotein convertase family protein
LGVSVDLTNSDVSGITLKLTDPDNIDYLLYDRGSTGTTVNATWPTPTTLLSGNLLTWLSKNPKGNWKLTIIDSKHLNNTTDGQVNTWSIQTKTLSTQKILVNGDLDMNGNRIVNLPTPETATEAASKS